MTIDVKKVKEIDVYSYRAGERQARADLKAELAELREHAEWLALCVGTECCPLCARSSECVGTPLERYRARYPEEVDDAEL